MKFYLVRRGISLLLTLFAISIVAFVIIRILPGDPAYLLAAVDEGSHIDQDVYESIRSKFALDRPIIAQYVSWLIAVLRGDWGISYFSRQEVFPQVIQRLSFTCQLAVLSWALSIGLGIPLGVWIALRRSSIPGILSTVSLVFLSALPNFWLGILLVALFSVGLGWLPGGGYQSFISSPIGWVQHMILPVSTLSLGLMVMIMRQTRSAVLEVEKEDYIITAKAKGLGGFGVVWPHLLKNALLPVVTNSGSQLGMLLGGAVVIETIFTLPGLGRFVLDSVIQRDYLVFQMGILTMASGIVIVNYLVDLGYKVIDPRIKSGE